jgi:Flp pilus assembly protein TadD
MSQRVSTGDPVTYSAALLLGLSAVALAAGPELNQARKLYNLTEFDQSLRVLQAIPDKDGAAYELMGRNYYMQSDYKKATEVLEKAVAAGPDNSEYALWLARAFGRRAETSSPFTAPGYASKARQYFEKAAQLNPRNLEALTDLFEYYLQAPGFLGGGLDKAQVTAHQIAAIDPAEGHWSQAKLAERRKEYGSAEDQLRRAIEVSPHQVGRFIDLARFLARQGRLQEADQSLARAQKIAPNSPKLVFAQADLYIKHGRNLELAKDLLKRYLSMTLSPDDPPKSQAEKLLRQVRGT